MEQGIHRTVMTATGTILSFWYAPDAATRNELGLGPRPLRETIGDTVRWPEQVGHLTPRQAGRLAREPA
jgi:hypothetical protein